MEQVEERTNVVSDRMVHQGGKRSLRFDKWSPRVILKDFRGVIHNGNLERDDVLTLESQHRIVT